MMSNVDIVYRVDEMLRARTKEVLDASSCTFAVDWFMAMFEEEPAELAKKLYKSDINFYDITALCFEIRGEDDAWTQELCDELETIYCTEEGK